LLCTQLIYKATSPRGTVLARWCDPERSVGKAAPDAKSFTLEAVRGSLTNGIVSNPFLEQAFRTEHR
jgi:hypothetical protein